ncbi:MAG: ECF-type sigma factor [Wenzhouxiangellaceae bacterium]
MSQSPRRGRDVAVNPDAANPLEAHPELYETLRHIARRERRRNPSQTMNTTVVVHEAWLRLSSADCGWKDQRHFLGNAALAMRHLLVDYARRRATDKRSPVAAAPLFENDSGMDRSTETVLALDHCLNLLEHVEPRLVRLVELRFFVGLTMAEVAECLQVSERTAQRDWQKARAFIVAAMQAE